MKEFWSLTEMLLDRSLLHGYWDSITNTSGSLPDSREGSAMTMIGKNIYLFGGFSREIYNDTRIYNQDTKSWKLIKYEPR